MKTKHTIYGVLLSGAVLTAIPLQADDKPATNTPAAPKTAPSLDELFPDQVVAKGKGFEIKRSRLDETVSGFRANAAQRGIELTPSDLPLIEKRAFDHLVQIQLLKPLATEADVAKAKVEADKEYDSLVKQSRGEEMLSRQLKSMNMTPADLRARILEEASALQVLRDKVTVTDSQVKKFYDDNPAQFEQPEMVRASHILISTGDPRSNAIMSDEEKKAKRKIIDDLLKRARGGEDFPKLAKEYSDDPGSKDTGGEYTFPRGQMMKEFEAAAFSLQTNQISDVVTTAYGYHIIKLSEKIPAKKVEFDKVKDKIKDYLEVVEIEKIRPDIVEKLKKEAGLQILDEQLKTMLAAADEAIKAHASETGTNRPATPAAPADLKVK